MNITILTKLLDAQKQPMAAKNLKKKHSEGPHVHSTPIKKSISKPNPHSDLPAPLPGRKLPVWKRKSIPTPQSHSHSHSSSPLSYSEPKWSPAVDPLSLPDNTPKPTRFEWPDDDLPPLNPMDTSFEEISYTSKPLLTQEEEQRATTSFDDLRLIPSANRTTTPSSKKQPSPTLDMEEMKNYVKEQKIRSGLSQDEGGDDMDLVETGQKRKLQDQKSKGVVKKVRFDEQDNKTTTISIATEGKGGSELNHEKIVTEILKKYPQLVKKNKNIRLKIMAKNKTGTVETTKVDNVQLKTPRLKVTETQKVDSLKPPKPPSETKTDNKAPWTCDRCSTDEEPVEFVLYYLYRKHMTDVHNEKFDPKLCKYCGHRCNKHNLLMYHLYTKHGMKPPSGYNFPKCDQCPFIALSANILSKHKLRHGKNEIQCMECKLAFTSQHTLTSHIQITGHTGKSNKNNYDCQYCTKRFQSGVNLFSHVRGQHKNEAVRDGIVSIDEMDDMEEYDDEETAKDEYILPEIITDPDPQTSKKVNILSNVKVQDRQEHHNRHQQLTLEPSSEAEALNNVATGIATSLGLVDIVVLNDNQQIFLQSNQQNFTNDQTDQPEFILPELTGRDSFSQSQNEVITADGVITQSMLSSSDIGSTDELVMVLTDHDYGDNQEEINNDNSNIVVLYSHPVDGQQDQFITSQGNIMVNSQGLIEIRNGATITSTANQVVMNPQETHIESIEMIQREIESHQELKQESLYEEESKPIVKESTETEKSHESDPPVVIRSDPLIESLTQGEQLEFTSPLVQEEVNQEISTEVETENEKEKTESNEEVQESNPEEEVQENEQTREISEEVCEGSGNVEGESETKIVEEGQLEEGEGERGQLEEGEGEGQLEEGEGEGQNEENLVTEEQIEMEQIQTEKPAEQEEVPEELSSQESSQLPENVQDVPEPTTESKEPEENVFTLEPSESLPQKEESEKEPEKITEQVENKEETEETSPQPEKSESPRDDSNSKTDLMEIEEEIQNECVEDEKNQEETSAEQELSQSDTSTSQFNDENSQSSQDSHQKEQISTKISILDDWEDTDSQQSDQKEKAKAAGEAVHKLMDDWEEEEEDESRKEIEG